MTRKRMARIIAKKTGLPLSIVHHILDQEAILLKECIVRQEEVRVDGVLRIRSEIQKRSIRLPLTGERKVVEKIVLIVRPMRSFRKELNKWTSTEE